MEKGAKVKYRGIQVGKVTDISYSGKLGHGLKLAIGYSGEMGFIPLKAHENVHSPIDETSR